MGGQRAMFTAMEYTPAEPEPHGFGYWDDIVSEDEEGALAAELGRLDLRPFEFHGHLGNRRVASFGLRYDFSRRSVERAANIPPFLRELLLRVSNFAGHDADAFRQIGVNEYRSGAGIGWHKDKPQFGIIVGISLLTPATMRFRRPNGKNWMRVSHTLKPRSIYSLSGEARTQWEHSIPPLNDLRYSITFRTLS
jgi:alkylated DNA repair dioxygenase AlkB